MSKVKVLANSGVWGILRKILPGLFYLMALQVDFSFWQRDPKLRIHLTSSPCVRLALRGDSHSAL